MPVNNNIKKREISLRRVQESIEQDENVGFCTSCGAESTGVEPHAKNYLCGDCGEHTVFGAAEVLMMDV